MFRLRRRGVLAAALALAAIVAGAVAFAASRSGGDSRGPLVPLVDGKVGMGLTQDLGKSLSISGPLFIRNASDGELVLDRVEAVGLRHGSPEILGAYVLLSGVNHTAAFGGYRVPATGRSLPGAVVGPHAQVQIVFGVEATKLGRHSFTALDIIYHADAASYRATVPLEVSVCAPVTVKDCRSPLSPPGF